MADKVECEVTPVTVPFKGKEILGVEVTCTRCEHSETSGGRTQKSIRRCLALMRENCPEGEENFYVEE